jgi:phosphoribosylanthranilate isomerase
MSLWIKICGLTTSEAVQAAVEAGADAVGFVFAPSKRQVTPEQAARIAGDVKAARVAVMQHPSQALLDEVWSVFRPDVLQTDVEDLTRLEVPQGLQVLPVLRAAKPEPSAMPTRLLFEGPVSGAGAVADWNRAGRLARRVQLVLAGGLDPSNVAAAIDAVRPYGVDVSSGVESAPGVKDLERIRQFVRAARTAASGANR